jgi:putative transposase
LEDGVPLTHLAHQQGLALRTAQRWVQGYRRCGLAGLARAPRADRGSRKLSPELQLLIEGLALRRPRPTVAFVHRQVRRIAGTHGWACPSYSTVYAVIRRLDPALITFAQEGRKAYTTRFDLLYRREAGRPNELWQADHTPLDLWVLDEHGQPARPWLSVMLDDYSRAVAAYRVSLQDPSALQTALLLRDAIWRKSDPRWQICGIPETCYTDHGSDFTSQHLEQVALDLKMQLVFSRVGEPRGRGRVERFFGTVHQLCVSALPGYRPAGAPAVKPTLTLADLEAHLLTFFLDEYHQRPHSETGQRPQERWAAGGFLPQLPDSLEQLDLLLLTVPKARRIQQDGIHFQGLRYLDLTLAAYVGETVTIRYDPRDLAEIRVYHRDRYLCRAVCQELTGQTIGLRDIIHARTERRHQVQEGLSARAQLVETLLAPAATSPAVATEPRPKPKSSGLKRYWND